MINTIDDVERMALAFGILPFFRHSAVPGLSIEDNYPPERWFNEEDDGPWEWKGPLIARGNLAYGKFFGGKAGYVALRWLPDFINYRRSLLPYPYNEAEREVMEAIVKHESLLTKEIRQQCGFNKPRQRRLSPIEKLALQGKPQPEATPRNKGFETIITRLQMTSRLVVADFEYTYDAAGHRRGWGIARYTTPELMYGDEIAAATCSPQESIARMVDAMASATGIGKAAIERLLKSI